MFKRKYIKSILSTFLVLMALWVATPKVYIHQLLKHNHSNPQLSKETQVNSQSTNDDCDFEEYNKPAYFNIFKFVFSFLPSKSKAAEKVAEKALNFQNISYAISFLRGPPIFN